MKSKIAFVSATLLLSAFAFGQAPAPRDYPKDVTVQPIPGVVPAGSKWEIFWWGLDNADGIVGTPDGGLIFAQREVNRIRKVDKDGRSSVVMENTNGAGALAIDYQGRIIAMLRDRPSVSIMTPERKILADNYQGDPFKGANDLVVERKGGIYFVESRRMPFPGVYYLAPDGKLVSLARDLRANGIMLSPDEKTLYVTNGDGIVAWDLLPDGSATNRRDFAKLRGERVSGDGMCIDAQGRLYVVSQAGVQVISPKGENLGVIPTHRPPLNIAFSGTDRKTLFVTGRGAVDADGKEHPDSPAKTIYKMQLLVEGVRGRAK